MRRRRVLVTAFGNGTPAVKSTTWLRARMYTQALAEREIDLKVSGTVPAWVFPWGWNHGELRHFKRAYGLITGAVKRLVQAIWLPYRYDVIVDLRDVYTFTGPPIFERLFRRRANFFVYELDDALFLQPEGGRPFMWTAQRAIVPAQVADRVIAGNSFLAEWARQYNDDVVVIPTTADVDITPRQGPRAPGRVRIGWYGSLSGAIYLEPTIGALSEVARKADVELRFLTDPAIRTFLDWPDDLPMGVTAWDPDTESRDLGHFDIGIMPLFDTDWSRGKCGAKILHYMAAGLPVVCSPVGVNADIVVHGETGLFARDQDEWVEALLALVQDADLRERMGQAGLARFRAKYAPAVLVDDYARAITPPGDVRRRRFLRRRS